MRVWLSKSVPHGAGLGGGSADAAAVLRSGVAALAGLGITVDPARIAVAALEVGSDVPALLSLSAQRVRGRGDRLEALTTPALHLAVASTTPSSTAEPTPPWLRMRSVTTGVPHGWRGSSKPARLPIRELMGSALEAAACRANPTLADALERAGQVVAGVDWYLTGSGGAVFSITAGRDDAEWLAAAMRAAGFTARACRTVG